MVPGSSASLNVADTAVCTLMPDEPLAGETLATTGGVVSGAPVVVLNTTSTQ
jgi:hypothetical protein